MHKLFSSKGSTNWYFCKCFFLLSIYNKSFKAQEDSCLCDVKTSTFNYHALFQVTKIIVLVPTLLTGAEMLLYLITSHTTILKL